LPDLVTEFVRWRSSFEGSTERVADERTQKSAADS
jgi:hypothetical protein